MASNVILLLVYFHLLQHGVCNNSVVVGSVDSVLSYYNVSVNLPFPGFALVRQSSATQGSPTKLNTR